MATLATRRLGSGPELVLVHGGAGPELTWERQDDLAAEFTLVIPWRRGYPPNPPVERQDWEADAEELRALAGEGSHLVGFSYGGLGAAVAAEREPATFASLTLIEVPLWAAAAGDPQVEALVELSERFAANLAADEAPPPEFLELAGMTPTGSSRAAEELPALVEIAHGMRSPAEARPDLRAVGKAMPCLVVSGDHHPGMERLCDAVAAQLGAERVALPGAGHAVPRAPGFNRALARFLQAAGDARRSGSPCSQALGRKGGML
jgi:pimeloyl-ACP methyl ester carboxylesterase